MNAIADASRLLLAIRLPDVHVKTCTIAHLFVAMFDVRCLSQLDTKNSVFYLAVIWISGSKQKFRWALSK